MGLGPDMKWAGVFRSFGPTLMLVGNEKKKSHDIILGDFSLIICVVPTFCERVAHEIVS